MKPPRLTPAYAALYPSLSLVARALGYALAIHGTAARDLDLIAVPWTSRAVSSAKLAQALADTVGGTIQSRAKRPHRRQAFGIALTPRGAKGPYLDLSILPRHGA